MLSYIIRRILLAIPTLIIVGLIVFFLTCVVPGDPVTTMVGDVPLDVIKTIRSEWGLDQPLYVQFPKWFFSMIRGNLGISTSTGMPVKELLLQRMPLTISLAILTIIVGIIIAIPLGVVSAYRQNTVIDSMSVILAVFWLSVPSFLLGFILILLFSVYLGWFPTSGYVPLSSGFIPYIKHIILPVLALGAAQSAQIVRMTRTSMLEVLRENYIQTARAKGLKERVVILKHALRNALIPVVTVVGVALAILLGGIITIEVVFSLPGMGRLLITAVQRRDYPVIQGIVIWISFAYILINLIVDLLYAKINPKITYS